MTAPKRVLFLGATGYLGSSVLSRFIALDPTSTYTAVVRAEDKAKLLDGLADGRVKTVIGDHSQTDKIEQLAKESDVVFNCADSDDVPLTKAVLAGLKARKAETGHRPILIHTSGTGTLVDDARGAYPTETIYSDSRANPTGKPPILDIAALPDSAWHRNVDLAIVAADKAAEIRGFIILPGTIFGLNKSDLVQRGVGRSQSQQVPDLIKASIDRKRSGTIGSGQNIWPSVSIEDTTELFVKVYEYATSGKKGGHGAQGYYFAESGEYTWFALAQTIGRKLVDAGIASDPEPTSFTEEEIQKYYKGSYYAGTNSRCRADHSRSIGWRPKKNASDFFDSIRDEVKACLAATK